MKREVDPGTGRRSITDIAALKALAHPERATILKLLMAGRPLTATECAAVVGTSPSACSYHMRQLERFGFVERVDAEAVDGPTDGRMRRWRAAAIGFSVGPRPLSGSTPEERAVLAAVVGADRVENDRLAQRFVERLVETDAEWQDAAVFSTYELDLTAAELERLAHRIDDLLRPHRAGAKSRPLRGSRTVHLAFEAFPRADDP
jgi:DNA-binding transcriptional ArsR family regulator